MNKGKQISYWVGVSNEDLITAELLINNNRLLHGLFWCHLAIEKIIKAIVVQNTNQVPPRSHNLLWLLDKTDISLNKEQEMLIGKLMVYQLEGRYPEHFPSAPLKIEALEILKATKNFHKWLINKL